MIKTKCFFGVRLVSYNSRISDVGNLNWFFDEGAAPHSKLARYNSVLCDRLSISATDNSHEFIDFV